MTNHETGGVVHRKRANEWARTFERLEQEVAKALAGLTFEYGVDVGDEVITIYKNFDQNGGRDAQSDAWAEFKAISQAFKAARIWVDYDDNTTPTHGHGTWRVVVRWKL